METMTWNEYLDFLEDNATTKSELESVETLRVNEETKKARTLKEAVNELDKVKTIKVLLKDSCEIITIKENGVYLLDKDKLLNKRVYNNKRNGNEEATIEIYKWR